MWRLPKKWPVALFSVALVLSVVLGSSATAVADDRPYFKTFGGDVFTGGWFVRNGTCNTAASSNYQDNRYGSPANDYYGGILTYAKADGSLNAAGGASSQYAVMADGKVHYQAAPDYMGFYSNSVKGDIGSPPATTNSVKSLTFSNSASLNPDWGGIFQGSIRQSHCIPDYFGTKSGGAAALATPIDSVTAGKHIATPPAGSNYNLVNAPKVIEPTHKLSVFVDGSVYIGHNITYNLAAADADTIPKFVLIAKGNIYIGPGVTRLEGWYIAQPASDDSSTPSANDGIIWTCHPNDQTLLGYRYLIDNPGCRTNRLEINGVLVAKQLNLMRALGNVDIAATSEDTLAGARTSANIAEIINYIPEMVIGGPFFNPSSSTSLKLDSLISLPPSL